MPSAAKLDPSRAAEARGRWAIRQREPSAGFRLRLAQYTDVGPIDAVYLAVVGYSSTVTSSIKCVALST